MPLSHEAFPRQTQYLPLALPGPVIRAYLMVLITCGLTLSGPHLSIVETETISSSFFSKKIFLIDF